MVRRLLFLLLCPLILIFGQPALASSPLTLPPGFVDELVVGGLLAPRAFVFTPDGRILIAERGSDSSDDFNFASIRVFKNGALLPTRAITFDTCGDAERGFLGIALDPDFANNGYIYVYYTRQALTGLPCAYNTFINPPNPNFDPRPNLGPRNRISRVTMYPISDPDPSHADKIIPGSEKILIDNILTDVGYHNAGDLHFDSLGYLYATTGDGGLSETYQTISPDHDTLNGKMIRIKPDDADPRGYVTTGNPYDTDPNARNCGPFGDGLGAEPDADPAPTTPNSNPCREVFASGFRNPFRFTIQPGTDMPFVGDVGGGVWEEVDMVMPGDDFGYPSREGPCSAGTTAPPCNPNDPPPAGLTNPIYAYQHVNPNASSDTADSAVIGGDFYTGTDYPAAYQNNYFFAEFARGFIRRLIYDNGTGSWSAAVPDFGTGGSSIIGLKAGPDMNLYYLAFLDDENANPPQLHVSEIRRIRYALGENLKPVAKASVNKYNGPLSTVYTFSAAGSYDPDNNLPLVYYWDFDDDGDGNPSTNPPTPSSLLTVSHTYLTPVNRTVTLKVRDTLSPNVGDFSDPVTLTIYPDNAAPTGTLILNNQTAPSRTTTYFAGDTWQFDAANLDDANGPTPTPTWSIVFHHRNHTHPFIPLATSPGTFQIPYQNFEPDPVVWFRVYLFITDSRGQVTAIQRDITPITSTITITTNPAGGTITQDGADFPTPHVVTRVVGMHTTIAAPDSQTGNPFARWSDGGAQSHEIVVPSAPTTYTAFYTANTPPVVHYFHALPVVLTWEGVTWATGYEVQIDDDPGFGSPLHTSPLLSAGTLSYTAPPLPNGQYYWRVQAKKSDGTFGTYSTTESFVLAVGG